MNRKGWWVVVPMLLVGAVVFMVTPVAAQNAEVKEKPPLYFYVGQWAIPRAQWADMEKTRAEDQTVLQQAMANGTIIGYGDNTMLVHQPDQPTHDDWWAAMSMAGLMNVLDQFYKNGSSTRSVLESATKHWDDIVVSRYYNWHSGSWKEVYSETSVYKLKPTADNDALNMLSKTMFVPVMEKLLAQGVIHEYDIDTEAIHTDAPGMIYVSYIAANADGLDKVREAIHQAVQANPLVGPAFDSMIDFTAHRDYLSRTNATFK